MYEITVSQNKKLKIATSKEVFYPTHTSVLCVEALRKVIDKKGTLLDLGCGSGIVGISAAKLGKIDKLYASDISKKAVELTKQNAQNNGVEIDARHGSLFEPWDRMRFDYILDDVSGVAEEVAKFSPWFGDIIPCATGPDGSELTCNFLSKAKKYLNIGGKILFPVISLSCEKKILENAKQNYKIIELINSQSWMLPNDMLAHKESLCLLKNKGMIEYEEKFGAIICWTKIYCCYN